MHDNNQLKEIATQVRRDILRMVCNAKSGHPGGSMSSTDILTTLYFNVMKQDPATWTRDGKGQDMFILSAGHMTPVYYSILSRAGYFPVSELATFRTYGSRLQGHPSVRRELPGIFQASGSLGQGLSAACGLALGKKLDNLIAMTDWNGKQIDGPVSEVAGEGDLAAKWTAWDWNVIVAEGHDFDSIQKAFELAKAGKGSGKPTMILFKTEMGHGVDFMAGTHKWHGKAPSEEQCADAMTQIPETLGDF